MKPIYRCVNEPSNIGLAFRSSEVYGMLPLFLESSCHMKTCTACGQDLADEHRYCTRCGRPQLPASSPHATPTGGSAMEEMNITVLYVMVGALILALLFPPWETPPGQSPEFLGFHFYWSPPEPDAIVSRLMMTIELTTIGTAGLYLSWLLRRKKPD